MTAYPGSTVIRFRYIEVYLPTCFSITGEGPGISFVSTDRELNFVAYSPGSLNRGPTVAVNKP